MTQQVNLGLWGRIVVWRGAKRPRGIRAVPRRIAPTNRVMTPARVVVPRARLVMVSARARDGRSIYRHMINDLSRSVVSRSYIVKTRSQHMN